MAIPVANGSSSKRTPMPVRRRRRKRSGSGHVACKGVLCVAGSFASLWAAALLYLHSSAPSGSGGMNLGNGGVGGSETEAAVAANDAGVAAMAGADAGVARDVRNNVHREDGGGGVESSPDPRLLALRPPSPNPWEGWQPPIPSPSSEECSFRDCFKKVHKCNTCRDSPDEIGPAPPVPDGWVPDVTVLRRMYLRGTDAEGNSWPPPLPEVLCEDVAFDGGKNGDINKRCLDEVPVKGELLDKTEEQIRAEGLSNGKVIPPGVPMPKVMCLVYTMVSEHPTRIRAIRETWGGGCDGFLAFSTESDVRIPAISLPHDGAEEYGNMWQKVRSIWRFVGTHYIESFDYFFIGGDDLLVMPQNLREYLWTLGSSENKHFVGRRFKSGDGYFNSGGAGYALSRGALRKFMARIDDTLCYAKSHTSMEDVMIAKCLEKLHGIGLTDTRDGEGRERFHPFAPGSHLTWKYPKEGERDWYEQYNEEWGLKLGKDCCAPDSVSWHYMKKPAMVRHIYSLLYLCGREGGRGGNLRKGIVA